MLVKFPWLELLSVTIADESWVPTTSSVSFMEVTCYRNGEPRRHISENANWCDYKDIVIIKQSCCSLQNQSSSIQTSVPASHRKEDGHCFNHIINLRRTIAWSLTGPQ